MFTFMAALLSTGLAIAAPIDSADIRIIDGDTIRVHHKPNVRLVDSTPPRPAVPLAVDLPQAIASGVVADKKSLGKGGRESNGETAHE